MLLTFGYRIVETSLHRLVQLELLVHSKDGNTNPITLLKAVLDAAEGTYIQINCSNHHGSAVIIAAYQ